MRRHTWADVLDAMGPGIVVAVVLAAVLLSGCETTKFQRTEYFAVATPHGKIVEQTRASAGVRVDLLEDLVSVDRRRDGPPRGTHASLRRRRRPRRRHDHDVPADGDRPVNMTKQTVCDWLDELKTMLPGNHPWLLEGQFEQVKRFVAMGSEKETALATATIPELFGELSRRHENALFVGEAKAASGDDRQILRLHTGEVAGLGLAQMALRSIAGPKGGVWGN